MITGGILLIAANRSGAQSAVHGDGFSVGASTAVLSGHDRALSISLKCPMFSIGDSVVGGQLPARGGEGEGSGGDIRLDYAPIPLEGTARLEVRLFLSWSAKDSILRKWASYRLVGSSTPMVVKEVVLEEFDTGPKGVKLSADQPSIWPPQSYPIFVDGAFAGIEFPVSSTRLESRRALLAHRPGIRMTPGTWYETKKAVYGLASPGHERRAFQEYIMAHSPGAAKRMFSWEPWVTLPIPYLESDHLELLNTIEEKLYKRHGVSIDACVITAGWSNPQSLWEIDKSRFPEGFTRIRAAGDRMKCKMGLWISPSSFYSFAQDTGWATEHGYETSLLPNSSYRVACLGGSRYQSAFKQRVTDMFRSYDIAHAYFDGYLPECPETNHGHEPGNLSGEAIADGLIDVFKSIRQINPVAWLEASCFGGNASPWWLFHVNTVLGNYGDDYCLGRVPSPVYRESYTTARDYHNLQGSTYGLTPAALQEVFAGFYNHTTEPVVNDAVMGLMRGNMLYLLCTNPKVMSDYGWAALADIIKWGRRNVDLFRQTRPLLPASWQDGKCPRFSNDAPAPREPYGYAHWKSKRGIISLRNPWITQQSYALRLDESVGVPAGASRLSAISLYPENRVYGKRLKYGDTLNVPLSSYETVVISIAAGQRVTGIPDADASARQAIEASVGRQDVRRVEFAGSKDLLGSDWTTLTGGISRALQIGLDADVRLDAPEGELLILCEETRVPVDPICTVRINGKVVNPVLSGPDLGYTGTVLAPASAGGPPTVLSGQDLEYAETVLQREQWLYLRYPLAPGANRVSLDLLSRTDSPRISVWASASKKGDIHGSTYPNSLPQPESLPLGSVQILAPVSIGDQSLTVSGMAVPVDRIDGVFLDSVEPALVSVVLQKRMNAVQGPLMIRGRTFLRGLGVVAPSKVAYTLDGSYRRFSALVGMECATSGNDKSSLVFQVFVDGAKRWESAPMSRWSEPVPVNVDLSGATRLELVVEDRARAGTSDHCGYADWADARLLR